MKQKLRAQSQDSTAQCQNKTCENHDHYAIVKLNGEGLRKGTSKDRFDSFVTSVLHRRVVPLVGSGVSVGSVPKTDELSQLLLKKLNEPANGRYLPVDLPEPSDPNDPIKIPFNRLAEMVQWLHGAKEACEVLKIKEWADIPTTPAHRYLALLAREGLIEEIITTNYDCGIELAWKATFGGNEKHDTSFRDCQVITGPDNMCGHNSPTNRPLLRLYKINGCAARHCNSNDPDNLECEILLTEVQLRGFDQRPWFRDLLRTILWTREIAFSGFGSDEPQVRYVIMDVLEQFFEFSNPKTNRETPRRNRRFLWVMEYEPAVSFHLIEALLAESCVRKGINNRCFLLYWPTEEEEPFENLFTAHDADYFRAGDTFLDAGMFWRRVWIETLKRRLLEDDDHGSAFAAFHRYATGCSPRSLSVETHQLKEIWNQVVNHAWISKTNAYYPPWLEDAQPAPVLCCANLSEKQQVYIALVEEPEYWVALMLLLFYRLSEQGVECRLADDDSPQIRFSIDTLSSVERLVVVHHIGFGQGKVIHKREEVEGLVHIRIEIGYDWLNSLREWWRSNCQASDTKLPDNLKSWIERQMIDCALHEARIEELEPRIQRRRKSQGE